MIIRKEEKEEKINYENISARYPATAFPVSSQYETKTSYILPCQ
ncbi:MAG TPA: hypothetical protein VF084_01800 [Nitrososphaeraceae archaeon]